MLPAVRRVLKVLCRWIQAVRDTVMMMEVRGNFIWMSLGAVDIYICVRPPREDKRGQVREITLDQWFSAVL